MAFLNQRNENHHSVLSTFHIIIASLLLLSVTGLSIITTCPVAFASSFADRSLCFQNTAQEGTETGDALNLTAKAAVLIENNSGRILYEKSKDKELVPASITKIMTLLLIFEALEKGKISLDDPVSVSNYAAQMGGSQVFLEPGEYMLYGAIDLKTSIVRFKYGKRKSLILKNGIFSGMLDRVLYNKKFDFILTINGKTIHLSPHIKFGMTKIYVYGGSGDSVDYLGKYYIEKEFANLFKENQEVIIKNAGAYFEEFYIPHGDELQIVYDIIK